MKKTLTVFCLIFLCSPSLYAITLENCISRALENSDLIKAYENQVQANILTYHKGQIDLLPQPAVTSESNRFWYGPESGFPRLHAYMQRWSTNVSWDLAKLMGYYPRLAHLEIEKSRLLAIIARNEVEKEVTNEYYRLYVLLKKKRDYGEVDQYFSDHIADIEKQHSSGVDVTLDLGRARVQQKSLHISLSSINAEASNELISLNSLTKSNFKEADFDSMTEPILADVKTNQSVFDENNPTEETSNSWVENAEANYAKEMPHLYQTKLNESDLKVAREAYRQNWFSFLPPVQFGEDHNIHSLDPATEKDRMFFSVSLSLLDFPDKIIEGRRLKHDYEYQQYIFNDSQRKLKVQINQLITNIESIQTIYKNAVENLKSSEENTKTAKIYYQQGKIKETDLLNVFSEYLAAKEQVYEALYDYLSKKAELDFILKGAEI